MTKREREDRAWLLYTTPTCELPKALRERLQGFECGEDALDIIHEYLSEEEDVMEEESVGRWEAIVGPNERKAARLILDDHVGQVVRIQWRDEDGKLSAVHGRLQRVSLHGPGRVVVTVDNEIGSPLGSTVTQFGVDRVHAAWLDTCF